MTTFKELVDNRIPLPRIFDSAMYIECIRDVRTIFPDAELEETGTREWRLRSGDQYLSSPHNSHPECWIEAREIIRGNRK